MKPKVSVIIPVYNTEKYVLKSINSVLCQTYKNIEVIVVDDGSLDNSSQLILNRFKNEPRVLFFQKENGGAGSARNMGLNNASGEFVLFLDSDDTLDNGAIDILYERIIATSSDIAMPCIFNEVGLDGKSSNVSLFDPPRKRLSGEEFAVEYLIKRGAAWRGTSVLYRSSIIFENNLKFKEGGICEDFYFNLDYLSKVKNVCFVDYPTLNVQKRVESVTASSREEVIDVYILLDKNSVLFMETLGFGKEKSRKLADKLLIRNTVVYFSKIVKVRYKEVGLKNAIIIVLKRFDSYPEIYRAYKRSINFSMNFTTRRKKYAASIIMILLKLRLYTLAAFLITL